MKCCGCATAAPPLSVRGDAANPSFKTLLYPRFRDNLQQHLKFERERPAGFAVVCFSKPEAMQSLAAEEKKTFVSTSS